MRHISDILKNKSQINEAEDKDAKIKRLLADLERLQSGHKFADHGAYGQDERRIEDIKKQLVELGYYEAQRKGNENVPEPKSDDPKDISVYLEYYGGISGTYIMRYVRTDPVDELNAKSGVDYPLEIYQLYKFVKQTNSWDEKSTGEWAKRSLQLVGAKEGTVKEGAHLKIGHSVWSRVPGFSGKVALVELS